MPNDIRLSELKIGAIINTSSGGCDSESEQKIFSILTRAGVVRPRVWCGSADEMTRSFREATEQNLDVLIVFGGDGTIRTAAEGCAEKGSYLIPLPRGNDKYALSGIVWRRGLGRVARKYAHCSLNKSAFRRSGRGQAVSYRRHCGGACAFGRTPRIHARGKYS
ncbi:MAG: hypothetical protein DMF00_01685 [Verrucomicrobia bacterium]|nr:MAG: hypothetical protein DMF00_01685 [Verrucomicrobiota bacterium]